MRKNYMRALEIRYSSKAQAKFISSVEINS